jgi:quercetin dioxygenase-like cupin family protein
MCIPARRLGDARRGAEVVNETRLEELDSGLAPVTDGWFVVNVRDAAWETNDHFGAMCAFEGESAPFADLGINLRVLRPGGRGLYHAESTQEDFLVLAGQCLLLVEGEERPLTAWDFVHCPPGTEHAFVATADGPCIIIMAGAPRSSSAGTLAYPRSELALAHGVGVETETRSPREAQSQLGIPAWRSRRPDDWNALPWA